MTTEKALKELDSMASQFIGHETTNVFAEIAAALRQEEAVRLAILRTVARALDDIGPDWPKFSNPLLAVHRMAATGLRPDDPRPEPLNIANDQDEGPLGKRPSTTQKGK